MENPGRHFTSPPFLCHHLSAYPAAPDARIAPANADQTAIKLVLRYLGPVTLSANLTYRQLLDQVNRFAAALHALGVREATGLR